MLVYDIFQHMVLCLQSNTARERRRRKVASAQTNSVGE